MITAIMPIALAAPSQPPLVVAGGEGEKGQQREDRDRGDVLQQRDAEDALAGGRGQQVALGEHAQADRRRRHRQAERRPPGRDASRCRSASAAQAEQQRAEPNSCTLPQPKMGLRSDHRRCGSSSRPTRNSISTTPNSAKSRISSGLVTNFRPQGPIRMPANEVADDRAEAEKARHRHREDGGAEVDQDAGQPGAVAHQALLP